MPLLRDGEFVEDGFITLDDETPLPEKGGVIVSWERLQAEFEALKDRAGGLGVAFPVTEEPEALKPYLGALAAIVLPFAAFADGRAYSLARIIRTRLAFTGELRAAGEVLPDQIAFMRQVGFDAFQPRSDRIPLETWRRAATAISLSYQSGFVPAHGFAPADIFEQRRLRRS
jgi:uncharacterized protein (DUF934 family)